MLAECALGLRATARRRRCPKKKPMRRSTGNASLACAEAVRLHERNIEALKKELGARPLDRASPRTNIAALRVRFPIRRGYC